MRVRSLLSLLLLVLLFLASCTKEEKEEPINHLPEIGLPISTQAFADSLFSLAVEVDDIDGDAVAVSAEGLPGWLSFDAPGLRLYGTPGRQDKGEHKLTIIASDGKGQQSRMLTIEVVILYSLQEKLEQELYERFVLSTPGLLSVSAAVATPDGQLLTATEGDSNPWEGLPVTPAHRYRMASVSKVFTAALVLRLAEEGYFQLDDKLAQYVPLDGLQYGQTITIRQLLSHTAGVVDHLNSSDFFTGNWMSRTWTNEDIIQYAVDHGALFQPGTGYAYSNTGFYFLGALIESVTQMPLAQAFGQWVFEPLGLENTVYDDFSDIAHPIPNLARNARSYEYSLTAVGAAGSIVATPADIARFGRAVYGGGFLSPASIDAMTTDYGFAVGGDHYGLGTRLWDDHNIIHHGHTGALMDYRTILMYVPAYDVCIALATNEPHANWFDLVNGVLVEVVNHYR
ncbi:MAG: serine hydrolase [Phaeodactylibacter sp.]|nr:serine hydrolase [Phaeodactylibacter sp.]MCB9272459.1 serine hydrolase [Lewinellaceae bacterium]